MAQPVIPDFGEGSACVTENRTFCTDWVRENWSPVLQPALLEHIELTLIAVGIGFAISLAAALAAHRLRFVEAPFALASAVIYTIPSLALFQLLVPFTGLSVTTVEVALVGYTLLILFRNTLTGLQEVPSDAIEAAEAMGLTRRQVLTRVELPLALPAIMAGLRIATTSTVGLAALAFFAGAGGLGEKIFSDIAYKSNVIVAGGLAVLLAAVLDALILLTQRAITPWTRAVAQQ
jgi:osmoprotectant transport system permease protein